MVPIGIPSRSLKFAMALRALVIIGFWPLIAVISSTAESRILGFWVASPSPMFSTIFSSFGTASTLV